MTASSPAVDRSRPWMFVFTGGLGAGALDIAYACVFWAVKADVPVQRILQSVAAGLLARPASTGGGSLRGWDSGYIF